MFSHTTPLQDRLALAPLADLAARATDHRTPARKRLAELDHALRAADGDSYRTHTLSLLRALVAPMAAN